LAHEGGGMAAALQGRRLTDSMMRTVAVACVMVLLCGLASAQVIDEFEGPLTWTAHPSDGVALKISQDAGRNGKALRMDFDFRGGAGYAIARKQVDLEMPPNYEFTFWMRADAPVNNLELKLIDSSGENVWWLNRTEFEFPRLWKRISTKKRQITFAWGPQGGGELRHVAAIEIVVTAGTGGRGTVWIDELALERLEDKPPTGPPAATASTAGVEAPPKNAVDGDAMTEWHTTADGEQAIVLDFGARRELGGLVIDWDADNAVDYDVETSDDSSSWLRVYSVKGSDGGRDPIYLPDLEARAIRLELHRSSHGRGYGIREITVEPPEWSKSPNDFFATMAAESRLGMYPRYLYGEQSYWTVTGVNGDTAEALVNTDGAVEPFKRGFSIEPFLRTGDRFITWNDVVATPSLAGGYLPIPSVRWTMSGLGMTVTAFAAGEEEASTLYVRYRVDRPAPPAGVAAAGPPLEVVLYLMIRPFQVNPPWQSLNNPGGVASVRNISYDGTMVKVNSNVVVPLSKPQSFGAASFDQGNLVESIARGTVPARQSTNDALGFASGVLAYPLTLAQGESEDIVLAVPLHSSTPTQSAIQVQTTASAFAAAWLVAMQRDWQTRLNKVSISLPPAGQPIIDTLRSNLAYILINRDGAALQPGSRSYERSWIRDGSLTSSALLRLGQADVVRDFLQWFAPYQFPSGKIPCCVDHRGADPVPENDSHGEFLYAIAEYYRYTHDQRVIEELWPRIQKTVAYIDQLRQQRMTPEYQAGDKRVFYGLVPESISHEGYSAKPMHSYWDDFFTLKGLKDAAYLAGATAHAEEQTRYGAMAASMRRDILRSIALSMASHHIDYIPGSAELGDFDATSTTTAIAPGGEGPNLPQIALYRTFDRYFANAKGRIDGTVSYADYTPYEWRTVGTFIRLGQKQRAHELVDFFLRDRRPAAWNQWAEVVYRDPRTPKFIGDMPHTWVGSDFIRSILDMFAYERDDGSLVVGAGIPESWVVEPGVVVRGLRTPFGALDLTMRRSGDTVRTEIAGVTPPAGVILHSPLEAPAKSITVNGQPVTGGNGREVRIRRFPAVVEMRY
jgi:hypothetical protein